jgi:hypothetical protein
MPYESLKKLHRLVDGFSSYCQSLSSNYSGSGQKVYVAQVRLSIWRHLSHYLRDTLYTNVLFTLVRKSQVSGYLKGRCWPLAALSIAENYP